MIVNELELTKLLVYGTTTPSSDPNTYIRPDADSSAPTPLSLSMIDYLTTGAACGGTATRLSVDDTKINLKSA